MPAHNTPAHAVLDVPVTAKPSKFRVPNRDCTLDVSRIEQNCRHATAIAVAHFIEFLPYEPPHAQAASASIVQETVSSAMLPIATWKGHAVLLFKWLCFAVIAYLWQEQWDYKFLQMVGVVLCYGRSWQLRRKSAFVRQHEASLT